ncbi:3-keto-disaccharide hydrolase [Pedobacter arcticus]|uniref:3-keto-disaccharide hydrolase n=1 Tax=Pedobacter arcticus TaxID=752140 RepID=UPI0002E478EE|nr:DUF1080 domain-containing protein [Pedobacter arcticus]
MFRISSFILLALCIATSVSAQNFKPLFNGKDLKGWKQLNGKADYTISKGEIIGTTKAGEPNSFLATEKDYGDFILELELLVDPEMNSGIQFRSESKEDYRDGRVHGYQMEVDPSARAWSGGIYDEARRNWLYTMELNPKAKTAFKNGVWNKYRIEAIGNTIRTWVNGVPTANLVDDLTPKGFIALQVHAIGKDGKAGKQIRWRNIKIQTENLKPSAPDHIEVVNLIPNSLSAQEKYNGYSLLFDGKSVEQWRGAYKKDFPKSGWQVSNGVLSVEKSNGAESTNGGDIVTKKQYSAFEFKFDFKLSEGANSGVKYFVTESEGNKGSAIGPEYQILDDERHPDAKLGKNGNRTLGSLYDLMTSNKIPASQKKIGEWNQGIIRVYPDNKIEYWLNGYKILEYTRGSKEFLDLVAGSKYKDWDNFGMAPQGHILLQDHGDKVSFRSLKIKDLN